MALIKCHECKTEISSEAKSCPKCGAPVKKKQSGCGVIVVGIFLLSLFFMIESPTKNTSRNEISRADGYLHASSNLWTGVKLFYGPNKEYVFEVVGGNDNYKSPSGSTFRGLKVRFPSGTEEWKDRDYIIRGDNYWIKADDPALAAEVWKVINY